MKYSNCLHPRHHSGFTLIELSIVLVIIGLVVGGVLVGQGLIQSAKMRGQISQIGEYTSAANTFRAKFGALPGDIQNERRSVFGLPNNSQGYSSCFVNDGEIRGCFGISNVAANPEVAIIYLEPIMFFYDLSAKGLIKDQITYSTWNAAVIPGTHVPSLRLHPEYGMIALTQRGKLGYYLGITKGSTNNYIWLASHTTTGSLSATEAYQLDAKLDDGIPSNGRVRSVAFGGGGGMMINDNVVATGCVASVAAIAYAETDTPATCRLYIHGN